MRPQVPMRSITRHKCLSEAAVFQESAAGLVTRANYCHHRAAQLPWWRPRRSWSQRPEPLVSLRPTGRPVASAPGRRQSLSPVWCLPSARPLLLAHSWNKKSLSLVSYFVSRKESFRSCFRTEKVWMHVPLSAGGEHCSQGLLS